MVISSTNHQYRPQHGSRATGLALVIALHGLLLLGLVTGGLHHDLIKLVRPGSVTVVLPELEPLPPQLPPQLNTMQAPNSKAAPQPTQEFVPPPEIVVPPPPPKPETARMPVVPVDIPESALPVAAYRAPPAPNFIRTACPFMVEPQMPQRAKTEGIEGTVRATAVIRGGLVTDITEISGPRVFHAAVKAAMQQYKCDASQDLVVATQEFKFSLADR